MGGRSFRSWSCLHNSCFGLWVLLLVGLPCGACVVVVAAEGCVEDDGEWRL